MPGIPYKAASSPALVADNHGLQLTFSQAPPRPAQMTIISRSLFNSYQVASGWAYPAADLGFHKGPSHGFLKLTHLLTSFRPHQRTNQTTAFTNNIPKRRLSRHQHSPKTSPAPWGQLLHNNSSIVVIVSPHNQSARGSIPANDAQAEIKAQLQKEGTHSPQMRHTWSTQLWWPRRWYHWTPQVTYYIRPLYQDWYRDITNLPNM